MSENSFYTPDDADALRRENELLAFEARFLRSRVSEVEGLESRLEEAERTADWLRRRSDNAERQLEVFTRRMARAELAEQDLVLLLERLTRSPFARGLRLWNSFRILEQRYLENRDV